MRIVAWAGHGNAVSAGGGQLLAAGTCRNDDDPFSTGEGGCRSGKG